MTREPGYYWVKIHYEEKLTIGEYDGEYWFLIGSEEIFDDEEFLKICSYIGDCIDVT